MEPLVSVIVPVYQVRDYLEKCIRSVLAQTYTNIELLLIDDGSTDGSGQCCDTYAAFDRRVRVHHGPNQGLCAARNLGLDLAQGELLFFMDSDDWMAPNALEILYRQLMRTNADMATGKFLFAFADGRIEDRACQWMRNRVMTPRQVLAETDFPVCVWGKLMRRHLFDHIRFDSRVSGEDLWIYPDLISACKRISLTDQVVCYYFQRWNSISYSPSRQTMEAVMEAKVRMCLFLRQLKLRRQARHFYHTAIGSAASYPDKKEGKQALRALIPFSTRLQLTGFTAHVRWTAFCWPRLYKWIYRTFMRMRSRRLNK